MEYKYTFLLPCLNEEKSLPYCIDEIKKCIKDKSLVAEILVSDNGSEDNSIKIAENKGARVVFEEEKGYGLALINGINNAKGKYCIMGDSDGSYDFYNIDNYLEKIREGYDLVVGNRFKGGIEKNAMQLSHKIGIRFLSCFANFFFNTPINDYHCGLRVFDTKKMQENHLSQKGMEYASEMIIVSKMKNLKMTEVSTVLRKDLRNRKSHLRTIQDGFRHLFLILRLFFFRNNLYKNKCNRST